MVMIKRAEPMGATPRIDPVNRGDVGGRVTPGSTRTTILVADAQAMVREGLRSLLDAQRDMRVVAEAKDGASAVGSAEACRPDVVVLDVAMPVCNGVDAAQRIVSARPATRVVLLSAFASSELVFRAFASGAAAFVLKEESVAELIAAIRAARAGEQYLSRRLAEDRFDEFALRRLLAEGKSPLEMLSPRERWILQRVCEGASSASIGAQLHLSPKTVETYRSRLKKKLMLESTAELVRFAIRHGLMSP